MKFGVLKVLAGISALIGAFLMAAVFEPKSKREMGLRAFVALGSSILFTGWAMQAAARYVGVDLHALDQYELIEFTLAIGGLVGALSWFVFGAAGEALRRFRARPIETLRDLRGGGGWGDPPSPDGDGA